MLVSDLTLPVEGAATPFETPETAEGPALVQSGGVDRLELKVPAATPYTDRVRELMRAFQGNPRVCQRDQQYRFRVDLQPFGIPAIVLDTHIYRRDHHKLVLVGVGQKCAADWVRGVQAVLDSDPFSLGIMRLDLAADVQGLDPYWFFRNCYVRRKQNVRVLGAVPAESAGTQYRLSMAAQGMSVYFGTSPDFVRIYDYAAVHALPKGTMRPLTRVERQFEGKAVPASLNTLGELLLHAPDHDPFDTLRFAEVCTAPVPDFRTDRLADCLKGIGVRQLVDELGLAGARRELNRRGGNASRILERYRNCWCPREGAVPELRELYRRAVTDQIFGLQPSGVRVA